MAWLPRCCRVDGNCGGLMSADTRASSLSEPFPAQKSVRDANFACGDQHGSPRDAIIRTHEENVNVVMTSRRIRRAVSGDRGIFSADTATLPPKSTPSSPTATVLALGLSIRDSPLSYVAALYFVCSHMASLKSGGCHHRCDAHYPAVRSPIYFK